MNDVRFYPLALNRALIEEIAGNGGLLEDLTQGSEPVAAEVSDEAPPDEAQVAEEDEKRRLANILTALDSIAPATTAHAPAAPMGVTPVGGASQLDSTTGRSYYNLTLGPVRLTSTAGEAEATQRYLTNLPDLRGSGASLMGWVRLGEGRCPAPPCLSVLFEVRDSTDPFLGTTCMAFGFVGADPYLRNSRAERKHSMPGTVTRPENALSGDAWRHVAWVLDEVTDEVRYYIDGMLAYRAHWGSAVAQTECSTGAIALGHAAPGYAFGSEFEVHDVRLYVHTSGAANPLSSADVLAIASNSAPGLSGARTCAARGDESFRDVAWADMHGHDCAWYARMLVSVPRICEYSQAAVKCPIACKSRQPCFPGNASAPNVTYLWDSIRRIEPPSGKGPTLCLGSALGGKKAAVKACREWVRDSRVGMWWESGNGEAQWEHFFAWAKQAGVSRIDFRDCDALAAAVDEQCTFDSKAAQEFSSASAHAGGDFTIAFWARAAGALSLDQAADFHPAVGFMSSLSPPNHHVLLSRLENASGPAEAVLMDACAGVDWRSSVTVGEFSNQEWSLVTISRSNKQGLTRSVLSGTTVSQGSGGPHTMCPFDAESLFTALEFAVPMLVSPIMLIPEALPVSKVQELYYASGDHMKLRVGPALSRAVMVASFSSSRLVAGPCRNSDRHHFCSVFVNV